ncbi:MAG: C4-type zinc ribbon domain-containing protein [Candidatus Ratteibacteria bacterium]|nr:C4-type zinc ribbon domain-containing protein [Candidatus Ratteibacteria bacterium]
MGKDELIANFKILRQIQQIDLELKDIQNQLNNVPVNITKWKTELENYKKEIADDKKEIEKLILEIKEKEIEVSSNQEALKKYNSQLYAVKTNKEYSSLLHEIDETKRKNSHIEDQILELMEKVDFKEKAAKEKAQKLSALQEEFEKKEREEKEREKFLNEEFAKKSKEKEEMAAGMDQSLLAKYQRISKSKDGLALVAITENSCSGCHMEIPPQTRNEVKLCSKTLTCERCGRILYCKESLD